MPGIGNKFDGKKILIWGYGREGRSSENFLKNHCKPECIDIFEGKRDGFDAGKYDHIIKSPGIVMLENQPGFTSQTEIFLECFKEQTVGITGTKGKSTTSALMAKVLSECTDKQVKLLGNIGLPCLDYYDEIDKDSIVVFEMSCHQLANVMVSPHIAVFLNLYEEHLDYYKTMDAYFKAKRNITKYQSREDYFYVGSNVPDIVTEAKTKVIELAKVGNYDLKIPGEHNYINAEFVYRVAHDIFKADEEAVRNSMATFEGLPHRLQFIGTKDGIKYYDDSISTIPYATIAALKALPETDTVLIGGMDRGIEYDELINYIRAHRGVKYIFSYEAGERIYKEVKEYPGCYYTDDLYKAVELAKTLTEKGKVCLLSPAAASYGYFKNFEHRGDMFKEWALS
ncbi:MAG: UDP-N-acetylmuramoyl-L-alanine--D-glutamate ligase [Lachnospiraceae bacterium]|nr:UDP-N-acetylmuramoyl-L-alanine--D-glutamate ligase [Lachnospiraceae bacterium]